MNLHFPTFLILLLALCLLLNGIETDDRVASPVTARGAIPPHVQRHYSTPNVNALTPRTTIVISIYICIVCVDACGREISRGCKYSVKSNIYALIAILSNTCEQPLRH